MINSEFKKLDGYHRRELILDTACKLFAEKSYDIVTVVEISNACGCSETMLFNLFSTKAEIYNALFEEWQAIISKTPTLELVNNSPLATLEKYFNDIVLYQYSRDRSMRPNLEQALFSRNSGDARKRLYDAAAAAPDFVFNAILPLIIAGQKNGEIRSGDPTELADFFWAVTQGALYMIKDFPYKEHPLPPNLIRNYLQAK